MVDGFCQLSVGHVSRNRFWGESQDRAHRSALCSSSLLWIGEEVLLVDPCLPYEQMETLLFDRTGRSLGEVTALFFTHPHGDHVVDADRYGEASLLVGDEMDWADSPIRSKLTVFPQQRFPGVQAVALPGHTAGSCGLSFAYAGRRMLIAGDAVMTRDFFLAEEGYFNSVDPAQASDTIRLIRKSYDVVVPGHDMLFWVEEEGT